MSQTNEAESMPLRFVVTVDTEADDAWLRPDTIELENIRQLPRFQDLCDQFEIVPTYLLTFECASRDASLGILVQLAESRSCEIGHHLHVWTCPPFQDPSPDGIDRRWLHAHQFLLPDDTFVRKAERLKREIERNFGQAPTAHRAGRWGVDQRTVDWLIDAGFLVETSLRPSMRLPIFPGDHASTVYSWGRNPHLWPHAAAGASIVEIPATTEFPQGAIAKACRNWLSRDLPFGGLTGSIYRRIGGMRMLRPNPAFRPGSLPGMIEGCVSQGVRVINLMLHSSELALGCSNFTRHSDDLARIWDHLREAFQCVRRLGIVSEPISDVGLLARQHLIGAPPQ